MELGISTDFANEPWELEEIKNKLREIAEAGFTHIHWCFDWMGIICTPAVKWSRSAAGWTSLD